MTADVIHHLPGLPLDAPPPGFPAEQIALSVPLVDAASGAVRLAVVAASESLSLAQARRAFGMPALRRATLDETRAAFPDLAPTAIPPFARLLGVPVVADRRLFTYNRVICGSGTPERPLLVDAGELLSLGGAEVADLCGRPRTSYRATSVDDAGPAGDDRA